MLQQVSIYAENKKGVYRDITGLLSKNEINILGSVTNDSAEYGMVRMVVSDSDKAIKVLSEAGYMCKTTPVLGIETEDKVGALNNLLDALYDANINVDYIYLSFNRESGKPIMVLHTDGIYQVENILTNKGFTSV
ncbi:MAG: amino acid-binding protein [Butyrivibrio sp.]|uniref:amino acid-binding protein n=1 Tax=Butyrivibrio sp. TaxID=28121 RepID=UPI0025E69FC5|nr:amino acid-binding protein [Butyrivibrio sp.]MCR5769801.1 amino acid-binding protein [Butyrivibrio sp.]